MDEQRAGELAEVAEVAEVAEMQMRLKQWRREHPQASFDEIEDAVQAEVVRWQAHLVAEVIAADADTPEDAPCAPCAPCGPCAPCAPCGRRMQRCGRRRRTVLSRLGQPIEVERDYYICPACGTGVFPPR
jgi:hypothetical protein